MTDKQYENQNKPEEISSMSLAESFIYNIEKEYPTEMTEEEKLKHKKDLEELAEILMEEYRDL